MKLASTHETISVSIAAPGCGFTVTLAGHAWLFNRDAQIVSSIVPAERSGAGHVAGRRIEACPICTAFVTRSVSRAK